MKIVKIKGETIREALIKVKEQYGDDAVILNTKRVKNGNIFGLNNEYYYELTVAIEDETNNLDYDFSKSKDNNSDSTKESLNTIYNENKGLHKKISTVYQEVSAANKNRIKDTQINHSNLSDSQDNELIKIKEELGEIKSFVLKVAEETFKNKIQFKSKAIQEIYNLFSNKDFDESFLVKLLMKLEEKLPSEKLNKYDYLLSLVKKSIIMQMNFDDTKYKNSKWIFFIGPTGVGKTTTIAKLSSIMRLIDEKEVGIISIDTFRIAAVEQLKTFANISSIPFLAAYNLENFNESIQRFKPFEKIFIDTAGRSPKESEELSEVLKFIQAVPEEERCVLFLLSATTKLKDMFSIYENFKQINIDGIIFTKIDEATTTGDVFNFLYVTKKPFLFLTNGQNVPDDIVKVDEEAFEELILQ